jgi:hypothetical protein
MAKGSSGRSSAVGALFLFIADRKPLPRANRLALCEDHGAFGMAAPKGWVLWR